MSNQLVRDTVESDDCCPCTCKIAKAKSLVVRAGCSSDAATVATLPDDWTPKRSGPILANYLKVQEQNHNKSIDQLRSKTCSINHDVDNKVRALAEVLVAYIEQNQDDLDRAVAACNSLPQPLLPTKRADVLQSITELNEKRLQEIDTFKQAALELENERLDRLKIMMRDEFQNVIKVGLYPPLTLMQDFNNRMYEFNEQFFDNIRAYDELEAELTVDVEDNVVRARSALNQLCIGMEVVCRSGSARRPSEKKHYTKRSLSVGEKKTNYQPIIKKIMDNSQLIEKYVSQLVEAYRHGIRKVFSGCEGNLKELLQSLLSGKSTNFSLSCLQSLDAKIGKSFDRITATIQEEQALLSDYVFPITDFSNIQRSLYSLRNSLRDTFTVLHSAGHLWDAHILRSAMAQKLTITAVEDLLTNHDLTEQANEVPFNLALVQMAEAPDEEKLNLQYTVLMTSLDKTAEMYLHHSNLEIARLEQYMDLPPLMANVLLAEFRSFLEKNKKNLTVDSKMAQNIRSSTTELLTTEASVIPRVILQTELQENALNNWRNGFLESLENTVSQIPQDLINHARQWIGEKSSVLRARYTMKCESHGVRAERIKALYERRLAELRHHARRLQSHLDALDEIVKQLPVEVSEYLSLDSPQLYPICYWLKRIDADMQTVLAVPNIDVPIDPEIRRLKMNSYAPRLTKHRQLFEDSLEEVFSEYNQDLENRLQMVRISNVRYAAKLKLFHQGGTYSLAEAAKTIAALQKASELVEQSENRLQDAQNTRRAQLLAMADTELLPLRKVVEGFVKADGKADKRVDKKEKGKKK